MTEVYCDLNDCVYNNEDETNNCYCTNPVIIIRGDGGCADYIPKA